MSAPRVFISYSHDSEEHKKWVLKFATDLQASGIEVILDQWDLSFGQDMSAFMQNGITQSDRVLLICSESYVNKADGGHGGVGYERLIVTNEVVSTIDTTKFIPVIRNNCSKVLSPKFLGPRYYADLNDDLHYGARLDELVREIHGVRSARKPPLGENPFSGVVVGSGDEPRVTGGTGRVGTGRSILDDDWFSLQKQRSEGELKRLSIRSTMEVRLGLHEPIAKSQIELLDAVEKSNIKTFGWPIAVVIAGNDKYKPRPLGDGVSAEIAIEKDGIMGRESYDLWSARKNGDFYTIQNLFEDQRGDSHAIYFNTRIVRVAEAILFAADFYDRLGVPSDTKVSLRVSHTGLKGRVLSAVGNRHVFGGKTSHVDEADSEVVSLLSDMKDSTAQVVRKICSPMFMLFDFAEFEPQIYDDIVGRFQVGDVS